jgi:hypothetical protein
VTAFPPACQRLIDQAGDDGCVDFTTACAFLGRKRDGLSYTKAHRYLARMTGKVDVLTIRPLRDANGGWREIPCHRLVGLRCRVDLLMPMVYPELSWPGSVRNEHAFSRLALRGGWTANMAVAVKG